MEASGEEQIHWEGTSSMSCNESEGCSSRCSLLLHPFSLPAAVAELRCRAQAMIGKILSAPHALFIVLYTPLRGAITRVHIAPEIANRLFIPVAGSAGVYSRLCPSYGAPHWLCAATRWGPGGCPHRPHHRQRGHRQHRRYHQHPAENPHQPFPVIVHLLIFWKIESL